MSTLLLLFVVLIVILFFTNPSLEAHQTKFSKKTFSEEGIFTTAYQKSRENVIKIRALMGKPLDKLPKSLFVIGIESLVSRENYYFFSLTKANYANSSEIVGFGILGLVKIFRGYKHNKVPNSSETPS